MSQELVGAMMHFALGYGNEAYQEMQRILIGEGIDQSQIDNAKTALAKNPESYWHRPAK